MVANTDAVYVVLKVAEVCNLDCKYCFFFYGGDDSYKTAPSYISEDLIRDTAKFLADGARSLDLSELHISFHGGEPLMLGKRRFEAMCAILHEHISPVTTLELSMQTNGVLIDEEWIDLLSAYEVGIGLSLDGPKHINDVDRVDKRGRGSFDSVMEGIRQLDAATEKGLLPGYSFNCVMNPDYRAEEIFDFFANELHARSLDLLFPIMDWTDYDADQARRVGTHVETYLRLWLEKNDPQFRIPLFSRTLGAMLSDKGAMSYAHALKNIIPTFSIRSDGSLCPDDALTPKSKAFRNTGYHVSESRLADFLKAEFWPDIHAAHKAPCDDCRNCKWFGVCGGGPAEQRFSEDGDCSSKSTYCDVRKSVFGQLYDQVAPVIGESVLDGRLEKARTAA